MIYEVRALLPPKIKNWKNADGILFAKCSPSLPQKMRQDKATTIHRNMRYTCLSDKRVTPSTYRRRSEPSWPYNRKRQIVAGFNQSIKVSIFLKHCN